MEVSVMERIYSHFAIDGLPISCNRYGSGHINETYLLVTNRPHLYILQKLNSNVQKLKAKQKSKVLKKVIQKVTKKVQMKLTDL
jgi:hypothetical protein